MSFLKPTKLKDNLSKRLNFVERFVKDTKRIKNIKKWINKN